MHRLLWVCGVREINNLFSKDEEDPKDDSYTSEESIDA